MKMNCELSREQLSEAAHTNTLTLTKQNVRKKKLSTLCASVFYLVFFVFI